MYLLDPSSGVPLYVQLERQVRQRILSGQLVRGEQLPSVRDLSAELRINPLTTSKVYQNLEREGLIETRRGLGTFVRMDARSLKRDARMERVAPAAEQLAAEALHLGLSEAELASLVAEKFRQLKQRT